MALGKPARSSPAHGDRKSQETRPTPILVPGLAVSSRPAQPQMRLIQCNCSAH